MDRISDADRIMLLLRQRLAEWAKTNRREKSGVSSPSTDSDRPLSRLAKIANIDQVDDRQARRALLEAILLDQMSPDLINEPRFQLLVDRVTQVIESDQATAGLLSNALTHVRAAAR